MSDIVHTPALLEIKRDSLTATGEFEGYASTFDNTDAVGDIIVSGAFMPALAIHKADGTMPALLWSHNVEEPIGRWLHFHEDDHGLLARGKLTLETRRGREAHALMKDNACSLSIGFAIAKGGSEYKGENRIITKIARLQEVSIVAIPANSRAKILSLKDSPRNLEKFQRDAGVPGSAAKRITSGGYNALAHRDDGLGRDVEKLHSRLDTIEKLLEKSR
jgi:HK97 family phage prohead protease